MVPSSHNHVRGKAEEEKMPDVSESDMAVFLGDLNYRLDGVSYDEARDFMSQRCFEWLMERDQLRAQMQAGAVFQGMREAAIHFPPTFKFERRQPGFRGIDSGEKRRIPAWCDRILFRGSGARECSLQFPVAVSVSSYESCMDVTDSDHKPVRCVFHVTVARIDEHVRRCEFIDAVGSFEKSGRASADLVVAPDTAVSTGLIILQMAHPSVFSIINRSAQTPALFTIGAADVSFPRWLHVAPMSGVIEAKCVVGVVVSNVGVGGGGDLQVELVVRVYNTFMLGMASHRVCVRASSETCVDCQALNPCGDSIGDLVDLNDDP